MRFETLESCGLVLRVSLGVLCHRGFVSLSGESSAPLPSKSAAAVLPLTSFPWPPFDFSALPAVLPLLWISEGLSSLSLSGTIYFEFISLVNVYYSHSSNFLPRPPIPLYTFSFLGFSCLFVNSSKSVDITQQFSGVRTP